MIVNEMKRRKIIEARYGRKTVGPHYVYRRLVQSIRLRKPISIIRIGDVVAKLLARREIKSLYEVSAFLGIDLPPSRKMMKELYQSVREADIVGVSHFGPSIPHIQSFMRKSGWHPAVIADAFINDQLYERGYLQRLISDYRVALVGRAAPMAAKQLRNKGIHVVMAIPLNHYKEIGSVMHKLSKHRNDIDLVLVGASVPGRIMVPQIAKRLGISAIEIGHMMDALSDPKGWSQARENRHAFKSRWMQKLKRTN